MQQKQTPQFITLLPAFAQNRLAFFAYITAVFVVVAVFVPGSTHAAWNSPSCNPDDVDPTDPTCAVSAPLNVSSADQTKTGAIEVQNTVSAEDLVISNAFSGTGNGTASITSSTGESLTIQQNDATASGIQLRITGTLSSGSANPGASAGTGIDVQADAGYGGYFYSEQSDAIRAYGGATGGGGIYAESSVSGTRAVTGINNSGADGVGGLFRHDTPSGNGAALVARNANVNANTTVSVRQGSIAASPVTGGAALNVQSAVGYGSFFNSTDATYGVGVLSTGVAGGVYGYTSTGSYGVSGSNSSTTGAGGYFTSTGTGGAAVYADASNYYGVYGTGAVGGVFGSASALSGAGVTGQNTVSSATAYGVVGRNTSTGDGYGGFFEASGTTLDSAGARIQNTAAGGTALQAYSGAVAPSPAPGGSTAIDASASTGNAIVARTGDPFAYSGYFTGSAGAVSAESTAGGSRALYATNTSSGAGYAAYFEMDSSDAGAVTVYAANPNMTSKQVAEFRHGTITATASPYPSAVNVQTNIGTAVYARSTAGDAAIIHAVADGGSQAKAGIFEASGPNATGLLVQNTDSSGNGIGIQLQHTGYRGIYIQSTSGDSIYIENGGGTGLDINISDIGPGIIVTSGSAAVTGIDINLPDFSTAIDANNAEIVSNGGFRGGQLYPRDFGSNTSSAKDNAVYLLRTISYTAYNSANNWAGGLASAAGDIWVGGGGSISIRRGAIRFNASTGQETIAYPWSGGNWDASVLVRAGEYMYAFPAVATSGAEYVEYNIYTDDRVDYSLSGTITGSAPLISSAAYDGTNIWIGTQSGVYRLNPGSTTLSAVSALSSVQHATDILVADGYIWVIDQGDPADSTYTGGDTLYKLNEFGVVEESYSVGDDPKRMTFDGAHLWIVNEEQGTGGGDSITRVNAVTGEQREISINPSYGNAHDIEFDGVHIWISTDNGLLPYNVSIESFDDFISGSTQYNDLLFDGTYLWAASPSVLDQYSIGAGTDHGQSLITNGVVMKDASNGNLYCVYVSAGAVQEDLYNASTTTPCN